MNTGSSYECSHAAADGSYGATNASADSAADDFPNAAPHPGAHNRRANARTHTAPYRRSDNCTHAAPHGRPYDGCADQHTNSAPHTHSDCYTYREPHYLFPSHKNPHGEQPLTGTEGCVYVSS